MVVEMAQNVPIHVGRVLVHHSGQLVLAGVTVTSRNASLLTSFFSIVLMLAAI